ncbi:MAG: oxidative damage protection protein [Polyangiaceae bacterium]|nr:oxidative damage protection protein [Polyangiaceae bacterium]
MSELIHCVKLGADKEQLPKQPFKGDLGAKVYAEVSKEAWATWLEHSKMMINEYRLDLTSESGQKMWMDELEKFFWGEGASPPPDFVPSETSDDTKSGD